jgi:hypothetical protein
MNRHSYIFKPSMNGLAIVQTDVFAMACLIA